MIAVITLRRNSDGKTLTFEDEWTDSPRYRGSPQWEPRNAVFQWTDGNGGCDCNRHLYFERALGRADSEDLWDEAVCGDELYTLVDLSVDGVSYWSEANND